MAVKKYSWELTQNRSPSRSTVLKRQITFLDLQTSNEANQNVSIEKHKTRGERHILLLQKCEPNLEIEEQASLNQNFHL